MLYKGLALHVAYTSSQLCVLTTPGHRLAKLGITLLTPNCARIGRAVSTRWCLILSMLAVLTRNVEQNYIIYYIPSIN